MKAIAGLLPWAVVAAVVGGVTWWLLAGGMGAGPWVLAAVIAGHGLVHVFFLVPAPSTDTEPDWPFDLAAAWPVTRAGVGMPTVRTVGTILAAVVVAASALAALSTVGILVPAGWWPAAVVVSAAASAFLLVLVFQPQLLLGLAIDAGLLGLVLAGAWMP